MRIGRARQAGVIVTRALYLGVSVLLLAALVVPQAGCSRSFVCADGDGICSETTEVACSARTGCSWDSECEAPFCNGADLSLSQAACTAVDGCVWDGSSTPACTAESIPAQCSAQASQAACAAAPHCRWAVGCIINVAVHCSDAPSQTACDKIGRCNWVETGPDSLG